MKLLAGKVIDGRIDVDVRLLPKGANVTVFVDDDLDDVPLDSARQAELRTATAEIARGEFVTPDELFEMLSRPTEGPRPRSG